jgi:hypothetical protein
VTLRKEAFDERITSPPFAAKGGAMRRLLALVLCLLLASTLGLGSVAHANEQVTCIEISGASSLDHANGDGDQVPADSEKGYPHHHGGCHGHHVAVPITSDLMQHSADLRVQHLSLNHDRMADATTDPALRPPQA